MRASILPISWAYIAMMGGEGLAAATRVAILKMNAEHNRIDIPQEVLQESRIRLLDSLACAIAGATPAPSADATCSSACR